MTRLGWFLLGATSLGLLAFATPGSISGSRTDSLRDGRTPRTSCCLRIGWLYAQAGFDLARSRPGAVEAYFVVSLGQS